MEELITYIVKNIVENPDEVKVVVTDGDTEGVKIFTITVKEDEKGKVIGKSGRTINAIRDIVKIRAMKDKIKAIVKIE